MAALGAGAAGVVGAEVFGFIAWLLGGARPRSGGSGRLGMELRVIRGQCLHVFGAELACNIAHHP